MDSLIDKLRDTDNYYLYDSGFLEFLEMNMADLRSKSQSSSPMLEVSATQRARADRNFNLLCNIANIPFHLHWITLRINGYKEYTEFRERDEPLYSVDMESLARLKLLYIESQRNS